jgi:hypothetical protein
MAVSDPERLRNIAGRLREPGYPLVVEGVQSQAS